MQLMDVVDTGTEPRRQGVAVQLAIVSQGEELLSGETVDTNSAWLAERCAELGHPVRRMVTAGDSIEDICWALQAAADAADVVLCTGGIGPTCDDLTAQAVAEWCDAELERRDDALELIKARYAAWDRPMDPANTKQADLPAGAQLLPNARGTAPGFSIINGATTLFCMPGVPFEMREMFQIRVQPALAQLGEASPPIASCSYASPSCSKPSPRSAQESTASTGATWLRYSVSDWSPDPRRSLSPRAAQRAKSRLG
jgi:molybdenum cofactor synthesis domain-containing protein